jgi:hypothetical protein
MPKSGRLHVGWAQKKIVLTRVRDETRRRWSSLFAERDRQGHAKGDGGDWTALSWILLTDQVLAIEELLFVRLARLLCVCKL